MYSKIAARTQDQDEFASSGMQIRRKTQYLRLNLDQFCICEHATRHNKNRELYAICSLYVFLYTRCVLSRGQTIYSSSSGIFKSSSVSFASFNMRSTLFSQLCINTTMHSVPLKTQGVTAASLLTRPSLLQTFKKANSL